MRLYTTVLHMHMSPLLASVGPVYVRRDDKVGTENTAHVDKIVGNGPKVDLLTAVVARRHQVRCDQAGILLERIESL